MSTTTTPPVSGPIREQDTMKLRTYLESIGELARVESQYPGSDVRDAEVLGFEPVLKLWTLDQIGVDLAKVPDEFFISIGDVNAVLEDLEFSGAGDRYTVNELGSPNLTAMSVCAHTGYCGTVWVMQYNARYCIVDNAGDVRVYDRKTKAAYTREAFKLLTRREQCETYVTDRSGKAKLVKRAISEYWLDQPARLTYRGVAMFPADRNSRGIDYRSDPRTSDYFNVWEGFAVEPEEGDFGLIDEHIRKVTCRGNVEHYEYLMNYMAHMVQVPWEKPGVAIITWSERNRTGKGTVTDALLEAIGQAHAHMVMRKKQATGQFAENGKSLLKVFEETSFSGDHETTDTLKAIISEKTMTVEKKGVDQYNTVSYTRYWFNSNRPTVVKAIAGDDRFFVLRVSDERAGDKDYFGAIREQMKNGGLAAFMHHLMDRDLSSFDVRRAPMTEHFGELVLEHLSPVEQVLHDILCDGVLTERGAEGAEVEKVPLNTSTTTFVRTSIVHGAFGKVLAKRGQDAASARKISGDLRKLGLIVGHQDGHGHGAAHYELASLDALRVHYAEKWHVDVSVLGGGTPSSRLPSENWTDAVVMMDALIAEMPSSAPLRGVLKDGVDQVRRGASRLAHEEARGRDQGQGAGGAVVPLHGGEQAAGA